MIFCLASCSWTNMQCGVFPRWGCHTKCGLNQRRIFNCTTWCWIIDNQNLKSSTTFIFSTFMALAAVIREAFFLAQSCLNSLWLDVFEKDQFCHKHPDHMTNVSMLISFSSWCSLCKSFLVGIRWDGYGFANIEMHSPVKQTNSKQTKKQKTATKETNSSSTNTNKVDYMGVVIVLSPLLWHQLSSIKLLQTF